MSEASQLSTQLPLWVDYLKAFLTPVIAAFGVGIAWQQWHVSRGNLKERLFDRRYIVFERTRDFLQGILSDRKLTSASLTNFHIQSQEARFLFDEDFFKYLEEIYTHAYKFRQQSNLLQTTAAHLPEHQEYLRNENEEFSWLYGKRNKLHTEFRPWIGLEKYK
ncbi:hypothetical protein U879_03045 [Defluviimonas sp. 20V17]|uniref:ATP synthase F0 subunit 8 n=1 Tax=Allgaiera indica TaxID=765699 RepID=A0A1H3DDW1_9RHOB|nr:hypothetical protein [Allgaiera indica]KDB05178.1 hypothetical protein U879_03045 [Defluviimonas sp. 20V17]SDX64510.1 hypothetical protein SAMN05444006_12263 [Allgaiera indica]